MKYNSIKAVAVFASAAVLCGAFLLGGCNGGGGGGGDTYNAGTYTGSGSGRGALTLSITVDATGKITDLVFDDISKESTSVGVPTAEQMKAAILEAGNANVNAISGGTVTSNGIKDAVNEALAAAKAN